jgi:hypothetical protein
MAVEPVAKPSRRVSFGNGNQLRVDVAEAVRAYDRTPSQVTMPAFLQRNQIDMTGSYPCAEGSTLSFSPKKQTEQQHERNWGPFDGCSLLDQYHPQQNFSGVWRRIEESNTAAVLRLFGVPDEQANEAADSTSVHMIEHIHDYLHLVVCKVRPYILSIAALIAVMAVM